MQQLLAGPHRLVRRHLVGDVHELGPHVAVGGVVEQVVVRDLQPHPRAVPAPVPQPDAIALAGPGQHLHPALHRPLAVVGVDELERALAHHLLRCPAEHLGRRPVDGHQHRELVLARGREARDDGRYLGKAVQHIARGTVLGEHHQDEHSVMRSDVEEVQPRQVTRRVHRLNRGTGGTGLPSSLPRRDHHFDVPGRDEVQRGATDEDLVAVQRHRGRHRHEETIGSYRGDEALRVLVEQRRQRAVERLGIDGGCLVHLVVFVRRPGRLE